jgi:hypothetical protein
MTKLQSTGVLGLVAAPIVTASGAIGELHPQRAGLGRDLDECPCGGVALRASRLVAAASIFCCLLLGATLAVTTAASLVYAQSPIRCSAAR